MANQFLDATEYANVMLLLLKNQLVMGRLVDGQFRDQVTDENGLSINVKRPPRFVAQSGAALAEQDIVTGSENVDVDQYKNVHVGVGDLEYVQSYNELMRTSVMQSAASELAQDVDQFLARKFLDFFSWVGTPGDTIGSPQEFNPAHTRLMQQSAPNADLSGVVEFADGEQIRGSLIGGDINQVNRNALERTRIPILSEIDLYASQNVPTLTTGTRTNGAIAGADQNVNYRDVKDNARMSQTLDIDGVGNGATISKGEVFTIANVEALNPRTRESVGRLQEFTVLEDATADGTGAVTLTISPAIIVPNTDDDTTSGVNTITNTAFATVNSVPANDAVVTWKGSAETSYRIRAAFHRRAISLVSARLAQPFTGESSFVQDEETGIGIRYWRGSDIQTGKHIHRWDMIYGAEVMDNYLGTRIDGAGIT